MSAVLHVLVWIGCPASLVVAIARSVTHLVRARLLMRAGSAALEQGDADKRREAALEIVRALTRESEPWYLAMLPWRRPGDDRP